MLFSVLTYYFFMKIVFFFSLVRSQVKFDTLKDHWLFLGILYTSGVAFLSYVFLVSWIDLSWAPWQNQVAPDPGCLPLGGLDRRDVRAGHALLQVDGEVRRGRDLLDPAAAGGPARHVLRHWAGARRATERLCGGD